MNNIEKEISFHVGLCSAILDIIDETSWNWRLSGELKMNERTPGVFLKPEEINLVDDQAEKVPTVVFNEQLANKNLNRVIYSIYHEIRHVWQFMQNDEKFNKDFYKHISPETEEYYNSAIERDAYSFQLAMLHLLFGVSMPEVYNHFEGLEKDVEKMIHFYEPIIDGVFKRYGYKRSKI